MIDDDNEPEDFPEAHAYALIVVALAAACTIALIIFTIVSTA